MKKKKQKKESCFIGAFKDISLEVVIEVVFSAIWNALLFIPRLLIRLFSSV